MCAQVYKNDRIDTMTINPGVRMPLSSRLLHLLGVLLYGSRYVFLIIASKIVVVVCKGSHCLNQS